VAVVVENAGGGGAIAAPIAGEVMRYFFAETEDGREVHRKYNQERPRPPQRPVPVAQAAVME